MRLTSVKIRKRGMSVDIETTGHNSLRWAVQAIDVNEKLAESLVAHSTKVPVLMTDSIFLLTNHYDVEKLPQHTHIVFWDGINSYVELLERLPAIATRSDLKFYVVGWLDGVLTGCGIHIESLYPPMISEKAMDWKNVFSFGAGYYAPYWYRTLTSLLTHTRYLKNWVSDTQKHRLLARGAKVVFCGLVTPTPHNMDSFFIGVNLPALRSACQGLTTVKYTDDGQTIDTVLEAIFTEFAHEKFETPSALACAYSVLNVMHRLKTLALLHTSLGTDLFVNEPRNSSRFDPYDSFFYKKNFYLDFGSTRGPDAIYPRTIDLCMTGKRFISMRYLKPHQTLRQYLEKLAFTDFACTAKAHAQAAATSIEY